MSPTASRRKIIATALAAVPLGWLAHQGWQLSAAPRVDKDCGPDVAGGAFDVPDADALPWTSRGGTVNDVSCLSRTPVTGVVRPTSETDIAATLAVARAHATTVSMAGARHSMGGHAFAPGGIVLDMTAFNRIAPDPERQTVTVQSGATWHDIQNAVHPRFAVKAMQSSDVFTVGGSISVNAHGMDHRAGAIERSARSMRVMLWDGTIVTASRSENADLYRHVVGGYGLFAIVLDAELDLAENAIYLSERRIIDYRNFASVYAQEIDPDRDVELFYGHLSTAPDSLLRDVILYTYRRTDVAGAIIPPLDEIGSVWLRRLIFNLSKKADVFSGLKWYLEREIEPRIESCTIEAEADDGCYVSRNEPMHDSVPYLFNRLPDETDILHEYFVPRDGIAEFIDGVRTLVVEQDAILLNASLRVVHEDDVALNYAPQEAFSLVLYFNQTTDDDGIARMARLTSDLIDLTHIHSGRFFLPYQRHYDAAQLVRSYPEIGTVFAAKRRFDPNGLFSNAWYEAYAASVT